MFSCSLEHAMLLLKQKTGSSSLPPDITSDLKKTGRPQIRPVREGNTVPASNSRAGIAQKARTAFSVVEAVLAFSPGKKAVFRLPLREDFDAVDLGIVFDGGKLEHDLTRTVRGGTELLHHCFVRSSCRCDNVKVAQYLGTVDAHVKRALTRCCPVRFRKVQPHGIRTTRGQAGYGIAERAITIALIHRLRCGIRYSAGADAVRAGYGCPTSKVRICDKGRDCRTSSVDLYTPGG